MKNLHPMFLIPHLYATSPFAFLPCLSMQTMAIATLAACYNNPNVFTGVVKIRKGQAVALMMASTNMPNFRNIMSQFAKEVSLQATKT